MILISHPRSGSEFLLRATPNIAYSRVELLNSNNIQTSGKLINVTFTARLNHLKNLPETTWQKIHGYQLREVCDKQLVGAQTIKHLRERKDLYFLKRENMRKSIISTWVAMINGNNYHGDATLLTQQRTLPYSLMFRIYQNIVLDTQWVENLFDYKEKFTLEGLLSGLKLPETFVFDPALADTVKRDSWKLDLIPNIEEVNSWLDDLKVPGTLDL